MILNPTLIPVELTILMTTYNRADLLKQNIENLMRSQYDFELLVMNDASVDNTDEIMASFSDSRITYEKNVVNGGYAYTLNKGIKLAKNDWIFLCEDDAFIIDPDEFIKLLLSEMQDNIIIGTRLQIKKRSYLSRSIYKIKKMIVEPLAHDMIGYNGDKRKEVKYCNNCFAFNKEKIKTRFDEVDYKINTIRIESDFQIRARKKEGVKILYNPKLLIDHKFYPTGGLPDTRSLYKRIENHVIFLHKHYSTWNKYAFIILNFIAHPTQISVVLDAVKNAEDYIKNKNEKMN